MVDAKQPQNLWNFDFTMYTFSFILSFYTSALIIIYFVFR